MNSTPDHRSLAETAAALWQIDPATLAPVSSRAHAVYAGRLEGNPVYLRLTNPQFRSFIETQAECDFLAHLEHQGVAVAAPLRSARERHVETVAAGGEAGPEWSAVVFGEAPGAEVTYGSEAWNDAFVTAWGQALGRVHQAALAWRPVAGWERKHWDEDYWIRNAYLLLPAEDTHALVQYEVLMAYFRDLPRTPETYAMTHGDFAPQNFRYDPVRGITAFDFANAGYHWLMWDLATSLSFGLRLGQSERHRFRTALIRGYGAEFPAGLAHMEQLDWFLRLRVFYVYLSRLWWFGPQPTPEQQRILAHWRRLIDQPIRWRNDPAQLDGP
jgi:Ser/Thr protein kinase RdoA (MazF antagonist)